jgi:hypothetical protein
MKTESHPWDCDCELCRDNHPEEEAGGSSGGNKIVFEITWYYEDQLVHSYVNAEVDEAPSLDSLKQLTSAVAKFLRFEIAQSLPGAVGAVIE